MILDLNSLVNSIQALEKAILTYNKFAKNKFATEDDLETIKSGVIQNFEVAYEQCWKFMKKWIEENVSPEIVEGVTKKELYRVSAENKLISDVGEWLKFHKSRNLTSHTYDVNVSEMTFKNALLFVSVAKDFQKRIEARND